MVHCQTEQRLAGKTFLRDLTLEIDAVGSVLHHGFHLSKARHAGQFITNLMSCPRGPLHKVAFWAPI